MRQANVFKGNRRGPTASQLADLLENEVFCLPELTIPVIREAFPTITEHLVLDTSATNEQVSQHNIVILDHERSIPEVEPTCQEPTGEPEIIEILHSKTSNRRRARVQSDSESSEALAEEPSLPKRKTRAAADDSEQEIDVESLFLPLHTTNLHSRLTRYSFSVKSSESR